MRKLCIANPRATIIVFLLLALIFGWANYFVKSGAVLDNALTNSKHPAYIEDQHVGRKFPSTEILTFLYRNPIDSFNDLEEIKRMSDKIQEFDWAYGRTWSLSTVPHIFSIGDVLHTDPIITEESLEKKQNFNLKSLKQEIKNDKVLYQILVGKNFDYATVVVFVPRGYNEPKIYWDVKGLLENRQTAWWEKYWSYQIKPIPENDKWWAAGWVISRETIKLTVFQDTIKLISLGSAIIFLILWLTFKSIPQAALSLGLIVVSLILVRGSIHILNLLGYEAFFGFPLDEKVYILFVYTNNLAQGCSYCVISFLAFNRMRRENPGLSEKEIWGKIIKEVHPKILLTSLIATGGLLGLFSFPVRAIQEMGILAGIGVGFLTLFSLTILPASYYMMCNYWPRCLPTAHNQQHTRFDSVVDWIIRLFCWLVIGHPKKVISASFAAIFLAGILIAQGKMLLGTNALDFIKGTPDYDSATFLNDRNGADVLVISVEPAAISDKKSIYEDVNFIGRVAKFQERIEKLPYAGKTISIADSIAQASQAVFSKDLPGNPMENRNIFTLLENSPFDPDLLESLYANNQDGYGNGYGIKILAPTKVMGDSVLFREFGNQVKEIANKDFPDLKITRGGKNYLWGVQDELIGYGKPINVLTSTAWVILICAVWLFLSQKGNAKKISPIYGGIIMALPLTFATAIIALAMIILKYPLNQANCVIMAMAIGISIDFSIHLVSSYKEKSKEIQDNKTAIKLSLEEAGSCIIPDTLANSLGLTPLFISQFQPVSEIGVFAPLMIILSAIGAMMLLMAMLAIKK